MSLRETVKDPATSVLVLCVFLLSSVAWGPQAGIQTSILVLACLWLTRVLRRLL